MSEDKLVSIAMATYNGEKYLREQLDSIYNQTYKNIEVVVCDDCSTDSTVNILEEYTQRHGLKYFVNEKNLGYTKNFEKSATLCTGEYIAFCDQDDIWLPEKIETLVNEIGNNLMIHSDCKVFNDSGIKSDSYKRYLDFYQFVKTPALQKKNTMLLNICVQGCTALCKKELIKKAFPIPFNESHDVWLGYFAASENKLKYIDMPLILWRLHQSTSMRTDKKWQKHVILFNIYKYKNIIANSYRLVRAIRRFFCKWYYICYYKISKNSV